MYAYALVITGALFLHASVALRHRLHHYRGSNWVFDLKVIYGVSIMVADIFRVHTGRMMFLGFYHDSIHTAAATAAFASIIVMVLGVA